LALSGGTDEDKKLRVGPNQWLFTPTEHGKFYYVEPEGKAIEAGRHDLNDLQEQMAHYGAEFLKKKPNQQTATARVLDSSESTSALQDVTNRFIDVVDRALEFTALWVKTTQRASVILSTDFGPGDIKESTDLQTLHESRKDRDIGQEEYLLELKRRCVLAPDFNIEENMDHVAEEVKSEKLEEKKANKGI
jgi:hypothetical protein